MRIDLSPNEMLATNVAYNEITLSLMAEREIDPEPLRHMSPTQQEYILNRLVGNGDEDFVDAARQALLDANQPVTATDAESATTEVNTPEPDTATGSHDKPDYRPYKVHPVADLFPLIEGADFLKLVADIRQHGLHDPVVLSADGSTIVDGRNRYRACMKAEIEPTYIRLGSDVSVVAFIISKNLARRHLTTSQRTMLAAQTMDAFKAEAKERQKVGMSNLKRGSQPPVSANLRGPVPTPAPQAEADNFGKASEQAARAAGVSTRSVENAKKLLDSRPDLAARVRSGEMTVHGAEQKVKQETGIRQPNYTKQVAQIKGCQNCKKLQAKADMLDAIMRNAEAEGVLEEIKQLAMDKVDD